MAAIKNISNKVFIINRSQLERRAEPEFYAPSIYNVELAIRKKAKKGLSDFIIKMASGATPLIADSDKHYTDKNSGIPFLRVQNLQTNGQLYLEDLKYINLHTHNHSLKRSQVSENDLLVKITGVGRMAIASVPPIGFVGNTNQHMVVIKTESRAVSEYLANYLNLDIIEKLASRRSTGGTRPALDYTALKSIPIIENIDFTLIKNAEKLKQQKEAQAKQLLESIDTYLLNELGIELQQQKNTAKDRIFVSSFSEVVGLRLDPDYQKLSYKDLIKAINNSKYEVQNLKSVTEVLSAGKTPASTEYSETPTEFPIIKVGSYSKDFIALGKVDYATSKQRLVAKKGDIFILSAAHQSEYVGKHIKQLIDEPEMQTSYVGELICVRANSKIEPVYLFSLLNSDLYKTLINREKTGQTSHVYGKDLKAIPIPVPPLTVQTKIVNHINQLRHQIKQLQSDATSILQNAKAEVEQMILG